MIRDFASECNCPACCFCLLFEFVFQVSNNILEFMLGPNKQTILLTSIDLETEDPKLHAAFI